MIGHCDCYREKYLHNILAVSQKSAFGSRQVIQIGKVVPLLLIPPSLELSGHKNSLADTGILSANVGAHSHEEMVRNGVLSGSVSQEALQRHQFA